MVSVAARNAIRVRQFSGEVVTLAGHTDSVRCVGAVLRTFKHHTHKVLYLVLLPDDLRFVSGSYDGTARIAYHGLAPPRSEA